jgi:hypothetical protein
MGVSEEISMAHLGTLADSGQPEEGGTGGAGRGLWNPEREVWGWQ